MPTITSTSTPRRAFALGRVGGVPPSSSSAKTATATSVSPSATAIRRRSQLVTRAPSSSPSPHRNSTAASSTLAVSANNNKTGTTSPLKPAPPSSSSSLKQNTVSDNKYHAVSTVSARRHSTATAAAAAATISSPQRNEEEGKFVSATTTVSSYVGPPSNGELRCIAESILDPTVAFSLTLPSTSTTETESQNNDGKIQQAQRCRPSAITPPTTNSNRAKELKTASTAIIEGLSQLIRQSIHNDLEERDHYAKNNIKIHHDQLSSAITGGGEKNQSGNVVEGNTTSSASIEQPSPSSASPAVPLSLAGLSGNAGDNNKLRGDGAAGGPLFIRPQPPLHGIITSSCSPHSALVGRKPSTASSPLAGIGSCGGNGNGNATNIGIGIIGHSTGPGPKPFASASARVLPSFSSSSSAPQHNSGNNASFDATVDNNNNNNIHVNHNALVLKRRKYYLSSLKSKQKTSNQQHHVVTINSGKDGAATDNQNQNDHHRLSVIGETCQQQHSVPCHNHPKTVVITPSPPISKDKRQNHSVSSASAVDKEESDHHHHHHHHNENGIIESLRHISISELLYFDKDFGQMCLLTNHALADILRNSIGRDSENNNSNWDLLLRFLNEIPVFDASSSSSISSPSTVVASAAAPTPSRETIISTLINCGIVDFRITYDVVVPPPRGPTAVCAASAVAAGVQNDSGSMKTNNGNTIAAAADKNPKRSDDDEDSSTEMEVESEEIIRINLDSNGNMASAELLTAVLGVPSASTALPRHQNQNNDVSDEPTTIVTSSSGSPVAPPLLISDPLTTTRVAEEDDGNPLSSEPASEKRKNMEDPNASSSFSAAVEIKRSQRKRPLSPTANYEPDENEMNESISSSRSTSRNGNNSSRHPTRRGSANDSSSSEIPSLNNTSSSMTGGLGGGVGGVNKNTFAVPNNNNNNNTQNGNHLSKNNSRPSSSIMDDEEEEMEGLSSLQEFNRSSQVKSNHKTIPKENDPFNSVLLDSSSSSFHIATGTSTVAGSRVVFYGKMRPNSSRQERKKAPTPKPVLADGGDGGLKSPALITPMSSYSSSTGDASGGKREKKKKGEKKKKKNRKKLGKMSSDNNDDDVTDPHMSVSNTNSSESGVGDGTGSSSSSSDDDDYSRRPHNRSADTVQPNTSVTSGEGEGGGLTTKHSFIAELSRKRTLPNLSSPTEIREDVEHNKNFVQMLPSPSDGSAQTPVSPNNGSASPLGGAGGTTFADIPYLSTQTHVPPSEYPEVSNQLKSPFSPHPPPPRNTNETDTGVSGGGGGDDNNIAACMIDTDNNHSSLNAYSAFATALAPFGAQPSVNESECSDMSASNRTNNGGPPTMIRSINARRETIAPSTAGLLSCGASAATLAMATTKFGDGEASSTSPAGDAYPSVESTPNGKRIGFGFRTAEKITPNKSVINDCCNDNDDASSSPQQQQRRNHSIVYVEESGEEGPLEIGDEEEEYKSRENRCDGDQTHTVDDSSSEKLLRSQPSIILRVAMSSHFRPVTPAEMSLQHPVTLRLPSQQVNNCNNNNNNHRAMLEESMEVPDEVREIQAMWRKLEEEERAEAEQLKQIVPWQIPLDRPAVEGYSLAESKFFKSYIDRMNQNKNNKMVPTVLTTVAKGATEGLLKSAIPADPKGQKLSVPSSPIFGPSDGTAMNTLPAPTTSALGVGGVIQQIHHSSNNNNNNHRRNSSLFSSNNGPFNSLHHSRQSSFASLVGGGASISGSGDVSGGGVGAVVGVLSHSNRQHQQNHLNSHNASRSASELSFVSRMWRAGGHNGAPRRSSALSIETMRSSSFSPLSLIQYATNAPTASDKARSTV